ncbi:MAG TPA: hypothetical protein VMD74_02675 [Candidatus Methylomirabilis sp.]|nr:hypothetical protein [Candidatus Methylomirabilis sp.]
MKNLYSVALLMVFFSVMILGVNQANALTLSPVRSELSGNPGQTLTREIIIRNEQTQPITFYSSFENFESQGETGAPLFVPGNDGLAGWIKGLPEKIDLGAQEEKTLPYNIEIPANADPGGYFSAIFWSTIPPEANGSQVTVGAKVGTLILLTVAGNIKTGGGVVEFAPVNKQKIFSSLPVDFAYRFQNSGSDRLKPTGELKFKNLFGFTAATYNANAQDGNILPNSVRKFSVTWAGKKSEVPTDNGFWTMAGYEWRNFHFGRYTAELDLKYGPDNKATTVKYGFYLFPWQLLCLILPILALLILGGIFGVKKYNRWIIRQAMKRRK